MFWTDWPGMEERKGFWARDMAKGGRWVVGAGGLESGRLEGLQRGYFVRLRGIPAFETES